MQFKFSVCMYGACGRIDNKADFDFDSTLSRSPPSPSPSLNNTQQIRYRKNETPLPVRCKHFARLWPTVDLFK